MEVKSVLWIYVVHMQVRWPVGEKHIKGSYEFHHGNENKDYSFGIYFMVKSCLKRSQIKVK
jgi:hypothetical protein